MQIVTPDEWRAARVQLLADEKALTKQADELAKRRAEMPMVKVEEDYNLTGPEGSVSLSELFQGRKQLILYHAMYDPTWDTPCKSCSFLVDQMPKHLEHLNSRATTLVMVSRAPFEKLTAFKKRMGWDIDWFSSYDSDFNYDFHVTLDEKVKPVEYNYSKQADLEAKGWNFAGAKELPGFSIFLKEGDDVFHSYSCYGRGPDHLLTTYGLLDCR